MKQLPHPTAPISAVERPRPARRSADVGYPTLRDFSQDRRGFLRRLAMGAMAVGVIGPLSACFDHHLEDDPDTSGPPHDPRNSTGPDSWSDPDAAIDDADAAIDTAGQEPTDPPLAGGMMEPEYFDVRLPASGFAQTYVAMGGYLSFAVRYVTWDSGVFGQFVADPAGELAVVSNVLAAHTCEEVAAGADVSPVLDELRIALDQYLANTLGYGNVEAVSLEVDYCDALGPIDGDMPEPSYP